MAESDFSLSQDLLHELFKYRDGILYWKNSVGNQVTAGSPLGTMRDNGYLQGRINNKFYRVHRLIFLYHHGFLPDLIDHIDGNRANNQIENLRRADSSQNAFNSKIPSNNTSGVKGVSWNKEKKKWKAECQHYKKRQLLGYFQTIEDAQIAVQSFRVTAHGEFANHG